MVQSIGGGGGNLASDVNTAPTPVSASAVLGANAGGSNSGGNLNLTYVGDVATMGDRAPGLLLQSIGGGGGTLDITGLNSLSVALGGTNATSGNGGNIVLSNTGAITTTGALSHGVVLQSIGGGGGSVFSDLNAADIALTLSAANSGNGGNIQFTQNDDIAVHGAGSIGILAQSLGGGGGTVDRVFAGSAGGSGSSGSVNIIANGNVVADGNSGVGVLAQSLGANGQGNINVTLAAGKSIFAGTGGTAIQISGGLNNHLLKQRCNRWSGRRSRVGFDRQRWEPVC
jgi:hypothetical protein